MSPKKTIPMHDTEHGWCVCGEWHENPGKFKRRLGQRDKGLLLWTLNEPLSYLSDPKKIKKKMRELYFSIGYVE